MPSQHTRDAALERVATHHQALREASEMAQMERALMLHAMRHAREVGVTYQMLAMVMGLSRQRVFDMLKDDERKRAPIPVESLPF